MCEDGSLFEQAIAETIATGEARTVKARSVGKNKEGEIVAEFYITWSFKVKSKPVGASLQTISDNQEFNTLSQALPVVSPAQAPLRIIRCFLKPRTLNHWQARISREVGVCGRELA